MKKLLLTIVSAFLFSMNHGVGESQKLYKMIVVTGKMLEQGNVINYESIQ